jgi:hypothetical protein
MFVARVPSLIVLLLLFVPPLAQAQSSRAVSSLARIGGGGGVNTDQLAAEQAVEAENAKIRAFNRKRQLEEIDEYNEEQNPVKSPPQKANNGELAAEKARSEQLARQLEAARKSNKKGPSPEFLATQAHGASRAPATQSYAPLVTTPSISPPASVREVPPSIAPARPQESLALLPSEKAATGDYSNLTPDEMRFLLPSERAAANAAKGKEKRLAREAYCQEHQAECAAKAAEERAARAESDLAEAKRRIEEAKFFNKPASEIIVP